MLKLSLATCQHFTPCRLKLPAAEAEVAALPDQHSLKPAAEWGIVPPGPQACHSWIATCGPGDEPKGKRTAMKAFTIAAIALALLVAPAHAQMGGKRHGGDAEKKADSGRPKVDEKAYKAALEKIPEPKEKYDPWGVARPSDAAKKSK
jgi:hypothetical protein